MTFDKDKSIIITSLVLVLIFYLSGCESARFKNAYRQDSIEEYKEFKGSYPEGEYSSIVDERIRELEEENLFLETKEKGTSEAFRFFLQKYPEGKYATGIRNILIIREVTRIAKSHEIPLAGAGGKDIEIIIKNKTGLAVKLFGMSRLLFEVDIHPDEIKYIMSNGYTILACKDMDGVIIPESYSILPKQDKVTIEIWLSNTKGNGKTISFFAQD